MLYRPDAFEPLTRKSWNAGRVADAIGAIVADADVAYRGPKLFWKAAAWDKWQATSPMKNLYVGTAGVLWALDELRRRAHAESQLDLADLAVRNVELSRARPDIGKWVKLPGPPESGFMTGESGILLVAYRLAPRPEFADALLARVRANVETDTNEIMWGAPGTLIVSRLMHEWTGDQRWRAVRDDTAEAVLARRESNGLWTGRLYGQEVKGLTPPHGVVGNVQALRPVLDAKRRGVLERDTAAILARTAIRENGLANWPPRDRPTLPGPDGQIRVQWCAGAPGMVAAAWDYMDEDLLLAGAELAWKTGPSSLEKGPGICHGTAGNGYAFLKAFARTGDELWLERARKFAVHALEQVERLPGRYSLWTGGVGVALYAAACIDERTDYPFFDA
jgi:Lanthionine synthetase C-like protein